jgi:DivIVA domain-containing protein
VTTGWFDEENRLTPEELQTVSFPMSRIGRRGFEEDSVREFLGAVHAEFMRLVNERASLWQEVQRLRRRIIAGSPEGDPQAVLFGEQDAHIHAVRILSTAQVTADRYVADAQAYSSRVTEEARVRRDDIMREAQQYSDMILEEAHARARDAAVTALNTTPAPQTERERSAAQAELAYLRTYSDVYRSHLRAYTEGVLRGIEEWERKEAASLQDAATALPSGQQLSDHPSLPLGNGHGNGLPPGLGDFGHDLNGHDFSPEPAGQAYGSQAYSGPPYGGGPDYNGPNYSGPDYSGPDYSGPGLNGHGLNGNGHGGGLNGNGGRRSIGR